MGELVASSAKGAVDSLIGRISTVLVNETQLLGRVRHDMQFIKDEMEMMNAYLLLLMLQQEKDNVNKELYAPWIKQARDLARDTEDCIEQYAQCLGAGPPPKGILLGQLRRVSRLVLSLSVRHRLATQIQDIKVRTREANDRRRAYDIFLRLEDNDHSPPEQRPRNCLDDPEDAWKCSLPFDEPPADLKSSVKELIKWLKEDDQSAGPWPRIIPIVGVGLESGKVIARRLCQDPSVVSLFDCKAWINTCFRSNAPAILKQVLSQHLIHDRVVSSRTFCPLPNIGQLHGYGPSFIVEIVYSTMPNQYKSCMLYLSIFPPGCVIRRSSLIRRWVVEGIITERYNITAQETASRCFDGLVGKLILCPSEIDDLGKVKTCIVHPLVHEVITTRAAHGSDLSMGAILAPPELARHLSIRFSTKQHMSPSQPISDILIFLTSLPSTSLLGLIKMLDLEGCKGLKKRHLKNICCIYLLKYLSLRNTDVTKLPKAIQNLLYLETLDIRQTRIHAFPSKSLVLPMLKHLHSGNTVCPSKNKDDTRQQELFSSVLMPRRIGKMRNMEILSHVDVPHGAIELVDVGQLLKLSKLGVVMDGADKDGIGRLFGVIRRLHSCLRCLSIRIRSSSSDDGSRDFDMSMLDDSDSLPRLLESLTISGIRSGLPPCIEHLHQLTRVTLCDTFLTECAIPVLGKLVGLRSLRLRRRSYVPGDLTIFRREFKNLVFLSIEGSDIVNIRFSEGAAHRLEKILWRFTRMDSLVGIGHLLSIKELELEGDCHLEKIGAIQHEIHQHPNNPVLKHIPAAN
uniref:Uncharacterized protein n=1 Tax=Oryza punctata TaxID=4537 RepID=A0A0E0MHS2_ORYPU